MSLSITAANVVAPDARPTWVTAGATITAGMPVYKDAADSKYKKCLNSVSAAAAHCDGIALNGASNGQPLAIAAPDDTNNINFGEILTAGQVYVVGGTAGAIDTYDDLLGAGGYVSIIGVATTTSNLALGIQNSGAALPPP